MSAPVLPPVGPDWQDWGRRLSAYIRRTQDRLSFKRTDDIPAENGIIVWDDVNGYPVVSKDGEWEPIILEDAMSADIRQAERVVFSTYGDTVSVKDKAKNLNKWGDNDSVGASFETVASFQGSEINETFVTTNLIDSIVSSSASDTTQTITIEGHTIDGSGNLTFTVQNATLNGQTEVTLTTPLARASRAYVADTGTFGSDPAALVGQVSIYDNTDGITSGVPNTAAATKLLIYAGATQTEKCATSVGSTDYWFLSYFSAAIGDAGGSANYVTCRIEVRDVENGGAWRPLGRDIVLTVGDTGRTVEFSPYLIVPKNHDVRARAKTNANTAEVHAEMGGYLALVT